MSILDVLWSKPVVKQPKRAPIPTEHEEQCAFVEWFRSQYPNRLMYAVPNGANKSKAAAAKFKREGLVSGVPDICIPEPFNGSHGLYIEMKRVKGSTVSDEQRKWHLELSARGYVVRVCYGCDEAMEATKDYFRVLTK